MPSRSRIVLVLACVLGAGALVPRRCQAGPEARAVRAMGPIRVDGALDEPAWNQAPWHGGFVSASSAGENTGAPRPAPVQTRFRVLFDEGSLYVGIECDEPQPEHIRREATAHDGNVWADDCVEIFLDPAGLGQDYRHFAINTAGVWYDDYGTAHGMVQSRLWDCAIEAAAQVAAPSRAWRAEVRLPFGALDLGERPSRTWGFNVARERYAGGALELTTWSPLKGNFHAPRLFGKLRGVTADLRRFALRLGESQTSVSSDGSGIHRLHVQVRVVNGTGTPRILRGHLSPFGKPGPAVQAEPVRVAPGKEATVAFPALALRDGAAEASYLLSLTDAESGDLLRSTVKRLSVEYRPLALEFVAPCYRDTIYATQKLARVVFRATLAPDVAAIATRLRWSLQRGAGAPVRRGTARTTGRPLTCSFPAAGLAVGRYRLVAEALSARGQVLARQEASLRRLPPPDRGNEVRVDEYGRVLVNGKPFLGIGWYGGLPFEDPRPDVLALQNVVTPVVPTLPDISPIHDAFARHGVNSIVSMENGRLYYSFELWKRKDVTVHTEQTRLSAPSEEMAALVRQMVAKVRGEPGLLGYYISDEPEINNVRSDYLENLYRLIREEDPYHPVVVTNDTLDGILTHGYRCADILNPDPYSPNPDYVPTFCKRVRSVPARGKALMLTLWHASSQAHFTDEYGTAPPYPYRVFRHQYLSGVAYGAVGFTGYASDFFMPEVQYRYGLPYVWRELRFLERAIAAPPPDRPLQVRASAEMAHWIRRADGHLYLVVVNHKPGTRRATVSHPLLRGVRQLFVLSEGRQVAVNGGTFSHGFAEGDAHVYTTDPRAQRLKTTRAVEAELAERERSAARPGNLLHWSRGTRALAAEGFFAPWFYQYFYYAINGITDDLGWCAYAWGGKPTWLELVLPAPAQVGRVVIYSPNLKDYVLDLRAPDGTVSHVTVQGNQKDVIEHSFQPAIPCVKLRLTVNAVRPTSRPRGSAPVVSEIEAYAEAGAGPPTPVTQTAAPPAPVGSPAETPDGAAGPDLRWLADWRTGGTEGWNWDPARLRVEPAPAIGLRVAALAPEGASLTRDFEHDPAHRYLQAKLLRNVGEGYRFVNVGVSSPGAPQFRGAINTARPGIYTVDLHSLHPGLRDGSVRRCAVTLFCAGAERREDGTVRPGPEFTFDWIRTARRPEDGLAVTLADGSPLPETLRPGDTLLFRLFLAVPAADAVVDVRKHFDYSPLFLNGQPYVQLVRTGTGDGREWAGQVQLGPGTGSFDLKQSGYPVLFRAAMAGGALRETYASAFVSVSTGG